MMRSVLDLLRQLILLVEPVDCVVPMALQVICARLQTTVTASHSTAQIQCCDHCRLFLVFHYYYYY